MRIWDKFKASQSIMAWNKNEETVKPYQPGGTGLTSTEGIVHRCTNIGEDTRYLRRWAWMELQGKEGKKVKVVVAY